MATKSELLKEARTAYHALATGTSPRVVVDRDGSRVEYTAVNKTTLYAYIKELELAIGCIPAGGVTAGPAQFLF